MALLCPDVWLLQSRFKFLNVAQVGLNGLVLRTSVAGSPRLVLVNPPKMTPEVTAQLRAIEAESGAKVEVILQPGDWHHFQLPAALEACPGATSIVASERNVRKQPAIKARSVVLERSSPQAPELGEDIVLLPWLGYSQDAMPWLLSGEPRGAARIEFVVLHRPSGTLFITDHFLPPAIGAPLKPNTGGFKLVDAQAARKNVQSVLDQTVRRVVFSHGPRPACVLETDASSVLAQAYQRLLQAHGAS